MSDFRIDGHFSFVCSNELIEDWGGERAVVKAIARKFADDGSTDRVTATTPHGEQLGQAYTLISIQCDIVGKCDDPDNAFDELAELLAAKLTAMEKHANVGGDESQTTQGSSPQ